MSTLRLRRAAFRIAAPDEPATRVLAAIVDGARPLLAGALEAAIGPLPARTIVVVRRLGFDVRMTGEASPAALATLWAQGAATALRAAWAEARAGAARDDASVAVFADRAEAIDAHLRRRLAGLPDAWWAAPALLGTSGDAHRADAARLDPAALLCDLAREDAHAAAATLHALARHDAGALDLFDAATASTLARLLAAALPGAADEQISTRDATPATDATADDAADVDRDGFFTAMTGTAALTRWRQLDPARRRPWRLAACLLAAREMAPPLSSRMTARAATPHAPGAVAPVIAGAAQPAQAAIETDSAGALLLLFPAATLFAAAALADRFRPTVLALLHRVLAPLPQAGQARALERERPLLDLLAPLPLPAAPIATLPQDPEAADALAAMVPDGIAWAPGAPHRIFGSLAPADTPATRLLLRPGHLLEEPGGAAILWPHEAADVVLRRLGWDRDPGFVPWLGRTLRFVFGAAP